MSNTLVNAAIPYKNKNAPNEEGKLLKLTSFKVPSKGLWGTAYEKTKQKDRVVLEGIVFNSVNYPHLYQQAHCPNGFQLLFPKDPRPGKANRNLMTEVSWLDSKPDDRKRHQFKVLADQLAPTVKIQKTNGKNHQRLKYPQVEIVKFVTKNFNDGSQRWGPYVTSQQIKAGGTSDMISAGKTFPYLPKSHFYRERNQLGMLVKATPWNPICIKRKQAGNGVCGDGVFQGTETCDDGNTVSGDGCSATCVLEQCGDGVVQTGLGEECDDGTQCSDGTTCTDDGDCVGIGDEACMPRDGTCNMLCLTEACGNGWLEGTEQCDDGLHCSDGTRCTENSDCTGIGDELCVGRTNDGCNTSCEVEWCGDGIIHTGEACDDGLHCSDGTTCTDDTDCTGIGDETCASRYGDGCSACEVDDGYSCSGTPTTCTSTCGDGLLAQGAEECDDGNTTSGDGCSNICELESCGDGIVDAAEECDDGNTVDEDWCSQLCVTEYCGDGIMQAGLGEECDDGNGDDTDGCDSSCYSTLPVFEICGDNILDPSEECDDGNYDDGDGCSAECILESSTCGDGTVDTYEECDDGNTHDYDGCSSLCRLEVCGDGKYHFTAGEECDDGNLIDGDGCDSYCSIETCGDGELTSELGEECDDGNLDDFDGCTAICTIELVDCGDDTLDTGEECDDGNYDDNDGCSRYCKTESCGDGITQFGEECDDGNSIEYDGCKSTCLLEECGDGSVGGYEECDDGNTTNGDGCDATCEVEW